MQPTAKHRSKPRVTRSWKTKGILGACGVAAFLFGFAWIAVDRLELSDKAKGIAGISASCDDLELSDLQRDFPRKSAGQGLAFRPYAKALEKCGTLTGKDRSVVRSIFGPHFDSDSRVDSWVIGYGAGLLGDAHSMAVFYSEEGLVRRVKIYSRPSS